jgi:hypothetical protein
VPLRTSRETVAVLYGDAPDGGELPPLGPLLDFVEHAGRTLDEAFLSRRQHGPFVGCASRAS